MFKFWRHSQILEVVVSSGASYNVGRHWWLVISVDLLTLCMHRPTHGYRLSVRTFTLQPRGWDPSLNQALAPKYEIATNLCLWQEQITDNLCIIWSHLPTPPPAAKELPVLLYVVRGMDSESLSVVQSLHCLLPDSWVEGSVGASWTRSTGVYLMFTCKSQQKEMPESYFSPFHSKTFSFTKGWGCTL